MKSNGCRDVQHTGLQSTQTRKNTGKQGAQTRGSSAHLPKHPYISGCTNNQAILFNCIHVLDNIFQAKLLYYFLSIFVTLNWLAYYNYHAATDVGMLGKMCRAAPCLCTLLKWARKICQCSLPVFLLVCVLCRPVCWTSLHPLISFEIFLLACLCTFLICILTGETHREFSWEHFT